MPDDALIQMIKAHGMARVRDQLSAQALRSIRIHPHAPAEHGQVPGASRVGGLPDLPADVAWPRRTVAGTPLAFLAQINLSEAAPMLIPHTEALLPEHGMLYFFADAEEYYGFAPIDADRWQVIYREAVPSVGPTPAPVALAEAARFRASPVTFSVEWTLPPCGSPMTEALNLTDEEYDAYAEAVDDGCIHRLLGHPEQIQGYVPHDVAMASGGSFSGSWDAPEAEAARATAGDWLLLLQLDSDWETKGMMWGDVGRLYFYIRREDLRVSRFDRTWLMTQSS